MYNIVMYNIAYLKLEESQFLIQIVINCKIIRKDLELTVGKNF